MRAIFLKIRIILVISICAKRLVTLFAVRSSLSGDGFMTRRFLSSLLVLSAVCLSGCGSDNGGGSTTVPPGTPTPTPTPSPTPTPTPTPTYAIALDFTQLRTSHARGVEVSTPQNWKFDPPGGFVVTYSDPILNTANDTAEMTYDPSDEIFQFRFGTDGVGSSKADIVSQDVDSRTYFHAYNGWGSLIKIYRPRPSFEYVNVLKQTRGYNNGGVEKNSINRYVTYGSETRLDDVPKLGSSSYSVGFAASLANIGEGEDLSGFGSLEVNYDTGIVSGSIPLDQITPIYPAVDIHLVIKITGTYSSATNDFTGHLSSSDGSVSGDFTGKLYGPKGTELGIIFFLKDGMDTTKAHTRIVGALFGKNS